MLTMNPMLRQMLDRYACRNEAEWVRDGTPWVWSFIAPSRSWHSGLRAMEYMNQFLAKVLRSRAWSASCRRVAW